MLSAGDKIGDYVLIKKLGEGGQGVVWLAEWETDSDKGEVALKIATEDKISLEAIKREAQLWRKASNHINVLPVWRVETSGKFILIVSQYAPDGSLEKWLDNHGGKMPLTEASAMMNGILSGLEHLHETGIMHRDLKPGNILLKSGKPCLADFGLARDWELSQHSTAVEGTRPYMAPETFRGRPCLQTDIWAAGVIFYQLLLGDLPFLPKSERDLRSLIHAIELEEPQLPSSIPQSIQEVILKALQKDPTQRYQSATEMLMALNGIHVGAQPDKAQPEAPVPPAQADAQRNFLELAETLPPIPNSPIANPNPIEPALSHRMRWLISIFIVALIVGILSILIFLAMRNGSHVISRNTGVIDEPLDSQSPTARPTPTSTATPAPTSTSARTPTQTPTPLPKSTPTATPRSIPTPFHLTEPTWEQIKERARSQFPNENVVNVQRVTGLSCDNGVCQQTVNVITRDSGGNSKYHTVVVTYL
jgi:serine/threonine protein kinase